MNAATRPTTLPLAGYVGYFPITEMISPPPSTADKMTFDPILTQATTIGSTESPPLSQPDEPEEMNDESEWTPFPETLPFSKNDNASIEIVCVSDTEDSVDLIYESDSHDDDDDDVTSKCALPGSRAVSRIDDKNDNDDDDDVIYVGSVGASIEERKGAEEEKDEEEEGEEEEGEEAEEEEAEEEGTEEEEEEEETENTKIVKGKDYMLVLPGEDEEAEEEEGEEEEEEEEERTMSGLQYLKEGEVTWDFVQTISDLLRMSNVDKNGRLQGIKLQSQGKNLTNALRDFQKEFTRHRAMRRESRRVKRVDQWLDANALTDENCLKLYDSLM